MNEQSFIRMKIGKLESGKEIWMCMEENRIDEWVRTQMTDFSIRDFVDAYCAFIYLSKKEIEHDFDLNGISALHSVSVMSRWSKKVERLMKTLKLNSEEEIIDFGSKYVIIEPSEF